MSHADPAQLIVRSAFARARAHELAEQTGLTATQIVEDALRAYVPPGSIAKVRQLVQRGPILVKPARGRRISAADADAALNAVRERED